jgi:hypothetical protein
MITRDGSWRVSEDVAAPWLEDLRPRVISRDNCLIKNGAAWEDEMCLDSLVHFRRVYGWASALAASSGAVSGAPSRPSGGRPRKCIIVILPPSERL